MENCIFCKIINKDIPSKKIYEDEFVYAFNDINPVAPTHVIVVPKNHIDSINDVNSNNSMVISKIFDSIPKIAKDLKILNDGYRIISNVGKNGGQTINHIHFHIIGGIPLGDKII